MSAITADFIADQNRTRLADHREDFDALGRKLARGGLDVEAMVKAAMAFSVAVPSWGVGTGGTRFAAFPAPASRAMSTTSLQTAA